MEFKEFVRLMEAGEDVTGVRSTKDSGDTYKAQSSLFDGKFNPNNHQKVINALTPKFKDFWSQMAESGNNRVVNKIKELKLNENSGARSLATLYARLLEDVLTDRNKNIMSVRDKQSGYNFKNRLQTQLGEGVSKLYPMLFIIGYDVLQGNFESAKKGSTNFIDGLMDINSLGAQGETIYKTMETFDKNINKFGAENNTNKEWFKQYINRRLQKIIEQGQDGSLPIDSILYMSPEEYDKLYFPDASTGDENDPFSLLKKDMFDAIKKAAEEGKDPFVRDTATDEAVKAFAEYVVGFDGTPEEKKELLNSFVDAIIAGSKGSRVGMPADVINKIVDDVDADFAREVMSRLNKIAGDDNEKYAGGPLKQGGGESKKTLASVAGKGATGALMSDEDVNKLKAELLDAPGSRQWGTIVNRYKNRYKISKDQFNDLKSFIDNDGDLGKKYPGKVNVGTLTRDFASMMGESAMPHRQFIESFIDRI